MYDLIGNTLVEKVLHDFEDPEVTVSFKADSVNDLLYSLREKFDKIRRKYEQIEECKACYDDFHASFKEICISSSFYAFRLERDNAFNLITDLLFISSAFVYKFLVSNIPFATRLKIFEETMPSFIILREEFDILSREELSLLPEKKKELLNSFNLNFSAIQNLAEKLIKKRAFNDICKLFSYGVDFSSYSIVGRSEKRTELDGKTLSILGAVASCRPPVERLMTLYESDLYLNVDEEIRNNDELLVMCYIFRNVEKLCEFISSLRFKVTEDKVRFLASVIMEDIQNEAEPYLKESCFIENMNKIALAIAQKATNEEEKDQMEQFAQLFKELTDIDKHIAQREQATQRKQLLNKRNLDLLTNTIK